MAKSTNKAEPILHSTRFLVGLILIAAIAAVLCFLPLTESMGYEFSLVLALPASLWAGLFAAGEPRRVRNAKGSHPGAVRPAIVLYVRLVGAVLTALAAPVLLSLLNTLRAPDCDFAGGLFFYLLGPVAGSLAAAACGLFWGLLMPVPVLPGLAWLLTWLGSIAVSVYGVYAGPEVYAYGQFFGYVSGPLYDELIRIAPVYYTYRLGTLLVIAVLIAIGHSLTDPEKMRLRLSRLHSDGALAILFFLALTGLFCFFGPSMGHRTGGAFLRSRLEELPYRADGIDLHYSGTIPRSKASRLLEDAEFRLFQLKRFFGIGKSPKISIFVFASAEEKKRLIGSGPVSISKPWLKEVYIQADELPHPVLKHELVHALSFVLAPEPLHLPAGWKPLPGLVEGIAVAAAWTPHQGLTPHEWSRAMLDLKLLPTVADMMGPRFLMRNQSASYTAAGSFLRFFRDRYGVERLKTLYATADFAKAAGKGPQALETEWHAFLRGLTLPSGTMNLAAIAFDRPGTIQKRCVHKVAALEDEASAVRSEGCGECSPPLFRQALDSSGRDPRIALDYIRSLLDAGEDPRAEYEIEKLKRRTDVGKPMGLVIAELEADMLWRKGDWQKAQEAYRILLQGKGDQPSARALAAKMEGARLGPLAVALRDYFVGQAGQPSLSEGLAILSLHRAVRELDGLGLPHYLLGRRYFQLEDYDHALEEIRLALSLGLELDATKEEAVRLAGVCLYNLGRKDEARLAFVNQRSEPGLQPGLRAELDDWIERCDFTGKNDR